MSWPGCVFNLLSVVLPLMPQHVHLAEQYLKSSMLHSV